MWSGVCSGVYDPPTAPRGGIGGLGGLGTAAWGRRGLPGASVVTRACGPRRRARVPPYLIGPLNGGLVGCGTSGVRSARRGPGFAARPGGPGHALRVSGATPRSYPEKSVEGWRSRPDQGRARGGNLAQGKLREEEGRGRERSRGEGLGRGEREAFGDGREIGGLGGLGTAAWGRRGGLPGASVVTRACGSRRREGRWDSGISSRALKIMALIPPPARFPASPGQSTGSQGKC